MSTFNASLSRLFDLIFYPLHWTGPLWALTVVSVLAGALLLWIFGKLSNQDAITEVRDRIRSHLIAIRLFGDDLGVLLRLLGRILRDNGIYVRHALLPLAVLLIPFVLIVVQIDLRYVARSLRPGEAAVVDVKVRDAATLAEGVRLGASDGVVVETSGVRIAQRREIAWRIRAESPGRYELRVTAGSQTIEKELLVGGEWDTVSRRRTGGSILDKLLHPGEPTIHRASPIESIEISYPDLSMRLFGFDIHWLIWFLVVSILSGILLRKPLGVEI